MHKLEILKSKIQNHLTTSHFVEVLGGSLYVGIIDNKGCKWYDVAITTSEGNYKVVAPTSTKQAVELANQVSAILKDIK